MVLIYCVLQARSYLITQRNWLDHFNVGAETKNFENEFPWLAIGHFQQKTAIIKTRRFLLGMPDLGLHPARLNGRKKQLCPLTPGTGINPEIPSDQFINLDFNHATRGFVDLPCAFDRI